MKKIMVFVSIIIAMFLTGCESNTEWSEPEVTSLEPVVYSEVAVKDKEENVEEATIKIGGLYYTVEDLFELFGTDGAMFIINHAGCDFHCKKCDITYDVVDTSYNTKSEKLIVTYEIHTACPDGCEAFSTLLVEKDI